MNINWKIRIKNPSFWVSVAIAIVTPILTYFGLAAQDLTTWGTIWNVIIQAVSNPYVILMVAVSLYNAAVDPTTTGVTDSSRVLQYNVPNNVKD